MPSTDASPCYFIGYKHFCSFSIYYDYWNVSFLSFVSVLILGITIPVSFIVLVMGLVVSILVKRQQEMNSKVDVVGVRQHQEERPGTYMETLEIDTSFSRPVTEYEVV